MDQSPTATGGNEKLNVQLAHRHGFTQISFLLKRSAAQKPMQLSFILNTDSCTGHLAKQINISSSLYATVFKNRPANVLGKVPDIYSM